MTTLRWKVLVSAPYAMPVLDWYREQLLRHSCAMVPADVRERLEEEDLLRQLPGVDGLICGDDRVTDRVLAAAPRLRVISKWGTGIDSIDQEACRRRGVRLYNTPNAFSEPVADSVFAYLLHWARQPEPMDRDIRAGQWRKPQLRALNETTLGVVGVGNCGKAVARRAKAFGMRLLGNDPVAMPAAFLQETAIEMVGLEELLRTADFITLHTTLNPTSLHLINSRTLAAVKPGAFLINTCRGPVVEEPALAQALETGQLAGAALDVFEFEPLPTESRLRRLPQCLLAPHNANSSRLAAGRVHENTIRNLAAGLSAATPHA